MKMDSKMRIQKKRNLSGFIGHYFVANFNSSNRIITSDIGTQFFGKLLV